MTTLAHMLPAERQPDRTWLAVVVDAEGQRHGIAGDSCDQASRRAIAVLAHAAGGMRPEQLSVSAAAAMWLAWKVDRAAWSDRTATRAREDLRAFCQPADAALHQVDAEFMRAYLERTKHLALAGQRTRWHLVTEFLRWCGRRKLVLEHPVDALDREDRPWVGARARRRMGRGKTPLRGTGECLAYTRAAAQLEDVQDRVAAVLPLLCGLRSGEVRHLRVGDVDRAGDVLWVRACDDDGEPLVFEEWDVKTASSRRVVELPEQVRGDLAELCRGQHPNAYVFRSSRNRGGPYELKWLQTLVARTCRLADVRVVCPHGLRVTWATMLSLGPGGGGGGLTDVEIGEGLGHSGKAGGRTARRHYVAVPVRERALRIGDDGGDTHVALAAAGGR